MTTDRPLLVGHEGGEYFEPLDTTRTPIELQALAHGMRSRVVGQNRAIDALLGAVASAKSGLGSHTKPYGTFLFLGPTGSGKTRSVEALAEAAFGSPKAFTKINCAEYQFSHEISRLVGSPPGYVGHRETKALLEPEEVYRHRTENFPFGILLFDEIEKASNSLWQLLLGVLDKGELTLGSNKTVNLTQTIVVMTSNLGAKEMTELVEGGIGFTSAPAESNALDQSIYKVGLSAAKRKLSPEFMNRIDKTVVFRQLTESHLRTILEIELTMLSDRVLAHPTAKILITYSQAAKDFLISEGYEPRYGARHIKRQIDRYVVTPLQNVIVTGQVRTGDRVHVDFDSDTGRLSLSKERNDIFYFGDLVRDVGPIEPEESSLDLCEINK